jgi:hypothetical protein
MIIARVISRLIISETSSSWLNWEKPRGLYIRIYSICKTVLAHESGDPGVQLNEKKTEGRKSRETVPLR